MVRTSDLVFACSVVRAYHPYVFRESSVTSLKLFKIQSQSLSIDVVLVGRIECRPSRQGYKKTAISIEFKYHKTQKLCYRIKRVLIHIFFGYVLELILTRIFCRFLNTY